MECDTKAKVLLGIMICLFIGIMIYSIPRSTVDTIATCNSYEAYIKPYNQRITFDGLCDCVYEHPRFTEESGWVKNITHELKVCINYAGEKMR